MKPAAIIQGGNTMDFNLSIPVKVISSENCVLKNASLLSSFGKQCLIVTGKTAAKESGALSDVVTALEQFSVSYDVFDRITPNPYIEDCHEAGVLAREKKADFIIGIGGGSALDAAKAVAVFAANESFLPFDIYEIMRSPLSLSEQRPERAARLAPLPSSQTKRTKEKGASALRTALRLSPLQTADIPTQFRIPSRFQPLLMLFHTRLRDITAKNAPIFPPCSLKRRFRCSGRV